MYFFNSLIYEEEKNNSYIVYLLQEFYDFCYNICYCYNDLHSSHVKTGRIIGWILSYSLEKVSQISREIFIRRIVEWKKVQWCGATNVAWDLRGLTRRRLVASRTHKLRFTRGSLSSRGRAPKIESVPSSKERVVDSRYRRNRVTGSSLAGGYRL